MTLDGGRGPVVTLVASLGLARGHKDGSLGALGCLLFGTGHSADPLGSLRW